ncbi:MAG: hypothetical protein MJ227_01030 [Bacilli bacterium]|nr:hypothetical protein [Bacilli bacterium]
MKKFSKISLAALVFTTVGVAVIGCDNHSGGGSEPSFDDKALSFSLSVNNGSNILKTDEEYKINVIIQTPDLDYDPKFTYDLENYYFEYGEDPTTKEPYVYEANVWEYMDLIQKADGYYVKPLKSTVITFKGEDGDFHTFNDGFDIKVEGKQPTSSGLDKKVTQYYPVRATSASQAEGGYNYSTLKYGDEDPSTEILGKLEKYAMDNHLTGISLFEDSGYICYNSRVKSPNEFKYLTNYGFGILSDGKIEGTLSGDEGKYKPAYYHTQSASNPQTINALNNQGSEVSSLYDYISSSYYSMKLNDEKNNSIWYPVLASNIARQVNGPIASTADGTETGLTTSTCWKIYVKCKENKTLSTGAHDDKLTYGYKGRRVDSNYVSFDGREVSIDDYLFAYQLLLTGHHNYFRGSELAGDTTYGIVGAAIFNSRTKVAATPEKEKELFNSYVGVKKGHDDDGYFITINLLNPVDQFTAMYTLSSSLYCPVPEDFVRQVGPAYYGTNTGTDYKITDNILSLAPYTLELWDDQNIDFVRNPNWQEFLATDAEDDVKGKGTISHYPGTKGRYSIAGVTNRINTALASDPNALFKNYLSNNVDAASIPVAYLNDVTTDYRSMGHKSEGSSVFKLNINSCTQAEWDSLFGPNGSNPKHVNSESEKYTCKPWMSNDNFLNGLNFSINRKQFADKRGADPSNNYFSNSYMSDARNSVSYNSTPEHAEAMKNYYPETSGYNQTAARSSFKKAIAELVDQNVIQYGTYSNPTVLDIDIWWMYESDKTDYGVEIENYFTECFNDPTVCGGKVILKVNHFAETAWDKVYSAHLQVGQFDLGFGAISGNTYSPLNFLEVLKSDDSSGFTLNWGTDTSVADPALEYDGKYWSFDSLWTAADHGGIFHNGEIVTTSKGYINKVFDELAIDESGSVIAGDLSAGGKIKIDYIFADIVGIVEDDKRGVKFEIDNIQLFAYGDQVFTFTKEDGELLIEKDSEHPNQGSVTVIISAQRAADIEAAIRRGGNIKDTDLKHYFQKMYYESRWELEFHYTMQIGSTGIPSNGSNFIYLDKAEMDKYVTRGLKLGK